MINCFSRPSSVRPAKLPDAALLKHYQMRGVYTDCYSMDLPRLVSFEEYVEAFYTSRLFKVERTIINLFFDGLSDDQQAKHLGEGSVDRFSAWTVEARDSSQILLCDVLKRTRSWLMRVPLGSDARGTRLYFGSAVMPKNISSGGKPNYGLAFHVLHGFHHAYTRALMLSALKKIDYLNLRKASS